MSSLEDALQQYIDALEKGKSLEQVLSEIPDEEKDLIPLLRLAAAIQETEHPQHDPEQVRRDLLGLKVEARNARRTPQKQETGFQPASLPGIVGILSAVLLLVLFGVGGFIFLQGPRDARSATLTRVNGLVEVVSERTGNNWRIVKSGDRVGAGAIVRTDAASTATLIFYDGSQVVLDANTSITLENVEGKWNREMIIRLEQTTGKSYHSVVPVTSISGQYNVSTPSATARAKGTKFVVDVEEDGRTRISVRSGEVRLSKNDTVIHLLAGQVLTATPDGSLENPAYQFTINGQLDLNETEKPSVSGMIIEVSDKTFISGEPAKGDYVNVEGRILANGQWLADEIELADAEKTELTFSGVVNAIEEASWLIGNNWVRLNENTVIGDNVSPGTVVDVTFIIQEDGSHLATRIEAIEVQPNPQSLPLLEFPVKEADIPGCALEMSVPAVLRNKATGVNDYAAGVELGYSIEKGEGYVGNITLAPFSWDQIAPGETVDFKVYFELPEWTGTSPGTEVRIRVFVADETNRPEYEVEPLTITMVSICDNEPDSSGEETAPPEIIPPTSTAEPTKPAPPTETGTPTKTGTAVPTGEIPQTGTLTPTGEIPQTGTPTPAGESSPEITVTPTGENTPSDTITPTDESTQQITVTPTGESTPAITAVPEDVATTSCPGTEPRPSAVRLSRTYNVSEEEIMDWYCGGFGFEEIDLAYSLSQQFGLDVDVIFSMRESGMEWGEIKLELLEDSDRSSDETETIPSTIPPEKVQEESEEP